MNGGPQWEYGQEAYEEEPVDFEEPTPRMIIMGASRSGKTSMSNVVFHKMAPHETLLVGMTNSVDIKYVASNAFVQFQIWDFPGDFDIENEDITYGNQTLDHRVVFTSPASLVYVIDAQDEPFQDAVDRMVRTLLVVHSVNPDMTIEVFIHKVDGELFLTDEQKFDCQQEIQQITDELTDQRLDAHINYHLTSIYDHSVFEAFSKVVQKLMPQLPALENLLNILISNCNMEKSFLFDVVSKIYIATDSAPVDMQSYELCSDMIDVVIDVSCIYGIANQRGSGDGAAGDQAGLPDEMPSTMTEAADMMGTALHEGSWAYDAESSSVIKLSNGMVLYLREVNNYLALVCLLRAENLTKRGLIDYNIDCLKRALSLIFHQTPELEPGASPAAGAVEEGVAEEAK
mmetsp:Transcript_9538/g.27047  ORF Transcript_9538/g.27047 Transcript_9538/m.27047 type:complete len:401 (-) Transcript_9538:184-1386(-)|eukprot:CAMPEP_0118976716 /NCGR_PEP_ID=MMETSP1173-20130426/19537_1 /TAXON_ID=1034831 /ORGANISM="Rhizochromulina marina cf, Strain CCMP1243" /LENGTH=400 /DNA_ID=CAMNT_0006926767 /DNA_START=108 /DNA_END=1310 /DNA_ORIENTATION=+